MAVGLESSLTIAKVQIVNMDGKIYSCCNRGLRLPVLMSAANGEILFKLIPAKSLILL